MKVKKILLSLSIIGITLFGYSYAMFPTARDCTRIGNATPYCIYELDIPNEFGYAYAGGREGYILNNVLDGYLNFENNQIILQDNNDVSRNLTFGRNNGKLYGITSYQSSNTIYGQGYIKICESSYSSNGFIDDCYFNNPNLSDKYSIDYNNLNLNANFDKYIYINTDYNGRIDWINEKGMFCFADTTNDYSLCFLYYIGNPDYGRNMFSGVNNLISNVQSGIGERYTIFDNSSPFNGGGDNGENIETTTGQEICTKIQEKINIYGEKYTTSLCWSDGTTTSGGEIIQTGYVNIFTAYPTYQDYANSYKIYQEYCNKNSPRYDYTECKNQLQGLPYGKAGATITRNGIESQLPIVKIYQYCRYQTHFTQEQKNSSGVCEFTEEEIYAPGITGELKNEANGSLIDFVKESIERNINGEYISPKDGTIFDDILPDGIISWKELISIDFVGNLTKIIAKLLVLFKTRPIVDGILPPVILSLLLLIVLFKMYKK